MEVGRVTPRNASNWQPPVISNEQSIAQIEALPYSQSVPFTSTIDLIDTVAARYPDDPALIFQVSAAVDSEVSTVSYAKLRDRIYRAATLLQKMGVQADAPVALIVPNIPTAHIAFWGAQLASYVFPINYLLGSQHIANLLDVSRARVVITLAPNQELTIYETVCEAIRLANNEIKVLTIDPNEVDPADDSFQAALLQTPPNFNLLKRLGADSQAAIFHTGGTTGLPKILPHSHRNELHTSCMAAAYYQFSHGDRMLNGFPLFHVAGTFVYGLAALAVGGTIYIPTLLGMRNRDFIANAWQLFEKHLITHLGCVPTTLASLCQSHEQANLVDRTCVRVALTGGSSLPVEIVQKFESQTGVPIRNIYGMTECAGIVAIEPFALPRAAGSVGFALPYTDVRALPLAEADKDKPTVFCEAGVEGVLCLRGPHVSPGYVDSSRNKGTFTENGWLISGDLGYVDAEGRIFITGRAKDLIIRSGHNIDPQVIEEAFLSNSAVLDCAAVGLPDAYAGELPVVFVTLTPEFRNAFEGSAQALEAFLLEQALPHIPERPAYPKKVYVLDSMPVTPVGKIFKPALRRQLVLEAIELALRNKELSHVCSVSLLSAEGEACEVAVAETQYREKVEKALLGLPISIEITVP